MMTSKSQIIQDIRNALLKKNEIPVPSASESGSNLFGYTQTELNGVKQVQVLLNSMSRKKGTILPCISEEEIAANIIKIQQATGNVAIGVCNNTLTQFLESLAVENIFTATPEKEYEVGIFLCESLVAWDSSILITDRQGFGNPFSHFPKHTVIIAFTSQVVPNLEAATLRMKEQYPNAQFPSQVAILNPETLLQEGKKLTVILIEDQE